MSDNERREHVRLPKSFRITLQEFVFPIGSGKEYEICCADISAGGLRAGSAVEFPVGEKALVKTYIAGLKKFHPGFFKVFESDAGQYLQAIAEIARCEKSGDPADGGYELGIKFTDVDEDDFSALRKFISSAAQEAGV